MTTIAIGTAEKKKQLKHGEFESVSEGSPFARLYIGKSLTTDEITNLLPKGYRFAIGEELKPLYANGNMLLTIGDTVPHPNKAFIGKQAFVGVSRGGKDYMYPVKNQDPLQDGIDILITTLPLPEKKKLAATP